MTVKMAGLWEFGYACPLQEQGYWTYPLKDFGLTELCMCPVSGILPDNQVPLTEYNDLSEVIAANPDLTRVFVDENGETPICDFVHPQNALYIFGKAGQASMATYKQDGDLSVSIPTCQNLGLLWPHQAAVLLMYHRFKTLGA